MRKHHVIERSEHNLGSVSREALCSKLTNQLHLSGDDLPEPGDMAIYPLKLLLTDAEPLFMLDQKVEQ